VLAVLSASLKTVGVIAVGRTPVAHAAAAGMVMAMSAALRATSSDMSNLLRPRPCYSMRPDGPGNWISE
jgi:hypothetical protein